jgi:DnaJ domain
MMPDRMAVKLAIDLLHVPSQVRLVRSEPLPDGVLLVLQVAAGEEEAGQLAASITGRSRETVRRSAAFFIEQILFAPNADSYRVLGAASQATAGELRRNVALLLRWLHPDLDADGARSIFAHRVTEAWNNLKTPERRAAYDAQRRTAASRKKGKSAGRSQRIQLKAALARLRARERREPLSYRPRKIGFFRRALSMLLDRPI